ncbi:unnamed protein product [Lampetra fluviatilis]
MVELLTAITLAGLAAHTVPGGDGRPPEIEERQGTSAIGAATIMRASETTRPEAAITCTARDTQPGATISEQGAIGALARGASRRLTGW